MKKKVLATVAIVLLLVITAVGMSLAFFTDETETAENTFTVGKVKILLDEALVNEDGEPVDENGEVVEDPQDAKRVLENSYDLSPGLTYTKDPTVTVEGGSNPCYVRVFVTLTEADKFLEIYRDHDLTLTDALGFFGGYDDSVWEPVSMSSSDIEDGEMTVEFRYVKDGGIVPKSDEDTVLEPVITSVTLPSWVTNEDAAKFPEGFKVNVVAQAIQAAGFDDADAAWEAFED